MLGYVGGFVRSGSKKGKLNTNRAYSFDVLMLVLYFRVCNSGRWFSNSDIVGAFSSEKLFGIPGS